MAKQARAKRPPKYDTLTCPDATAAETAKHYTLAPFDRIADDMDRKWGVDRLPGLVSPETAEKVGETMGQLSEAIRTGEDLAAWVGVAIRAYQAMDREATEAGMTPASQDVMEFKTDDGTHIAIMRDIAGWSRLKAERPELRIVSLREAVHAIVAYDLTGEIVQQTREAFPNAEVARIKPSEPVDYANGGDEIIF